MSQGEVIAVFDSRMAGELAVSLLRSEGLRAHLLVDDAGGMHPELQRMTGGVRLSVTAEDAALARDLLAEDHTLSTAMLTDGDLSVRTEERPNDGPDRPTRPGFVVAVALGVIVLLVATALAVQQGGILQL